MKLNEIAEGSSCVVKSISLKGAIRRRLQDLGLIEGTNIYCVLKSPKGNPIAYCIRGAIIALRNSDTEKITVEYTE